MPLYHGSPKRLEVLKPYPQPGRGNPTSVYATPRRGLAVFFSVDGAHWSNLRRRDGHWEVHGLTQERLSRPGWLYTLPADTFRRFKGWQHVSDVPVRPLNIKRIPDPGQEMRRLGMKVTPAEEKNVNEELLERARSFLEEMGVAMVWGAPPPPPPEEQARRIRAELAGRRRRRARR